MVILAHDTTSANVDEIIKDKEVMEAYAKKNGVKIEYVTMSKLYERIVKSQHTLSYWKRCSKIRIWYFLGEFLLMKLRANRRTCTIAMNDSYACSL